MAETKVEALKAYHHFIDSFGEKYPKAVECLVKDKEDLFTFYDFPGMHCDSYSNNKPHRVHSCNREESNEKNERMWLQDDHPDNGLQTVSRSTEDLGKTEGLYIDSSCAGG